MQDSQGYAKEISKEFIKQEMQIIGERLSRSDVCITTAQVFGKKAPMLIQRSMVSKMKPGSVIVDLAIEQGGNCELSKSDHIVVHQGVKILAPVNITSQMAMDASRMFSKNIENLVLHILSKTQNFTKEMDTQDEIISRTLLTKEGVEVPKNL